MYAKLFLFDEFFQIIGDPMFDMLFSYEGRYSRSQFWLSACCLISFTVMYAIVFCILSNLELKNETIAVGIGGLILLIYSNFCIVTKRLHDRNKSGWFQLIALIPFGGLWLLIECGFLPGDSERNSYGDGPFNETDYRLRSRSSAF